MLPLTYWIWWRISTLWLNFCRRMPQKCSRSLFDSTAFDVSTMEKQLDPNAEFFIVRFSSLRCVKCNSEEKTPSSMQRFCLLPCLSVTCHHRFSPAHSSAFQYWDRRGGRSVECSHIESMWRQDSSFRRQMFVNNCFRMLFCHWTTYEQVYCKQTLKKRCSSSEIDLIGTCLVFNQQSPKKSDWMLNHFQLLKNPCKQAKLLQYRQ